MVGIAYWQKERLVTYIPGQSEVIQPLTPSNEETRVKVLVQRVTTESNARIFEAVGTGRARLSVQLYPAVAELVEEVFFTAGEKVKAGQILMQLEDDEEILAERLAEVNVRQAKNLLARYESAVQVGAVPESEVDSARADFDAAEVAVDQARLEREKRKIRAPFDGVVGITNVDPGDRVDSSTVITTLDDRSIIFVEYEIPESLLSALTNEAATQIEVSTSAYPGRKFEGTVLAEATRFDVQRRTLTMRVSIENADDILRPGMSFAIRWFIPGEVYPTVPEIALQWAREGSYVWIVRDGTALKIPGRVVARSMGRVLIDAEITEDDLVVIEGIQRLRPGSLVEVLSGAEL